MIYRHYLDTPIGILEIKASDTALTHLIFPDQADQTCQENGIIAHCCQQLDEYFNHKRILFDLPLDPKGTTFQKQVWSCLTQIPFGQAICYQDIADQLNNPKAVRAVGAANGQNPISIIVPCHRVIGKNRSLTGYAGGLHRKAWLLDHENINYISGPAPLTTQQQDLFD